MISLSLSISLFLSLSRRLVVHFPFACMRFALFNVRQPTTTHTQRLLAKLRKRPLTNCASHHLLTIHFCVCIAARGMVGFCLLSTGWWSHCWPKAKRERERREREGGREGGRGGHAALCAGGATRLVHCFYFAQGRAGVSQCVFALLPVPLLSLCLCSFVSLPLSLFVCMLFHLICHLLALVRACCVRVPGVARRCAAVLPRVLHRSAMHASTRSGNRMLLPVPRQTSVVNLVPTHARPGTRLRLQTTQKERSWLFECVCVRGTGKRPGA